MSKQQTAVEWFFMTMNIRGLLPNQEIVECYNQAKEIYKEQIHKAYHEGYNRRSYIHDQEYGGIEYWENEPRTIDEYYKQEYEGEE